VGKLTTSRRYNLRTLAAIKPWGNSEGASRVGLTRRKYKKKMKLANSDFVFLAISPALYDT
jgi:hypothetical protein